MNRAETSIGFRDPDFNIVQYNRYAKSYADSNPSGLRGGKTPTERVALFSRCLSAGSRVFEIGPGPGHDAEALVKAGYDYTGGDVAQPFIENLINHGFRAIYFNASKDPLPRGFDGLYAHISLEHISPRELCILLSLARERLENGKALFFSVIEGFGHERSARTGDFNRDWSYYPAERFRQILVQEGVNIATLEQITTFSGTPTIHVTGNFKEPSEIKRGSYGDKKIHPFGDVYYSMGTLYKGNIVADLADAQVEEGLLDPDVKDYMLAAENIYNQRKFHFRKRITYEEFIRETNAKWARGLAGNNIKVIIEHAEHFINQSSKFRSFVKPAFAVCNNNGFNNIINSHEPSWLVWLVAKHLGADSGFSSIWHTDITNPFSGNITEEVTYPQNRVNLIRNVLLHQRRLRKWLDTDDPNEMNFRRILVGVGNSISDAGFLAETDYPLAAFPNGRLFDHALAQGEFDDNSGKYIHADSRRWNRWSVAYDEKLAIIFLNMITSDRYPILHNVSDQPLWKSRRNNLNANFYKENPLSHIHIL